MTTRTPFEATIETQELTIALSEAVDSETVTYNALSDRIGQNVQTTARGILASARRRLMRDGIVFETVMKVGLKRLPKAVVATGIGPETNKKVRALVRRQIKKASTISQEDYAGLTKDEQTSYNVARSHLGVLAEIAKEKSSRNTEKAVAVAGKPLPLAETLKAFRA